MKQKTLEKTLIDACDTLIPITYLGQDALEEGRIGPESGVGGVPEYLGT